MNGRLFVTHESDVFGCEFLGLIEEEGGVVSILRGNESAPEGSVAIFTYNKSMEGASFPGRHIRTSSLRLYGGQQLAAGKEDLHDYRPLWAKTTLFVNAVREVDFKNAEAGRRDAAGNLVRSYQEWYPGKAGHQVPWDTSDNYSTSHAVLPHWLGLAKTSWGAVTLPYVVAAHGLTAVVGDIGSLTRAMRTKPTLVIMGCAAFNGPHTDIAAGLLPDKADRVRKWFIETIDAMDPFIERVLFVVAGTDFLEHEALKASLHPFFWPSVSDIESILGRKFQGQTRLKGDVGGRDDGAVADSMAYNFEMIQEQLVRPIIKEKSKGTQIDVVTFTDYIGRKVLDNAWQIAQEQKFWAETIYDERVANHEWYALLDESLGRESGLRRTIGNNAVYIAEIDHLVRHPHFLTIDCEVDDQFWRRLNPILSEMWGDTPPYIGVPNSALCQPWTY